MLYLPFHCLPNCSNFLLFSALITQTDTDLVQENIHAKKQPLCFSSSAQIIRVTPALDPLFQLVLLALDVQGEDLNLLSV